MEDALKIIPKKENPLKVWINKKHKTITFKSGKISSFKQLKCEYIRCPYSISDKEEIQLTYGLDRYDLKQQDIEKLEKLSNFKVRGFFHSIENPLETSLYLIFQKGTKIAIANYESD